MASRIERQITTLVSWPFPSSLPFLVVFYSFWLSSWPFTWKSKPNILFTNSSVNSSTWIMNGKICNTPYRNSIFSPKIQIWKNPRFGSVWIFAVKIECNVAFWRKRGRWYFNFRAKNQDFAKTEILTFPFFGAKIQINEFSDSENLTKLWIFRNKLQFLQFCTNFWKLNLWTKNLILKQCADVESCIFQVCGGIWSEARHRGIAKKERKGVQKAQVPPPSKASTKWKQ